MHSRTALGIMAFAKEVSPSTPSTEDNHTQGLAITHTLSSSLQTQVKHAMLSIWGARKSSVGFGFIKRETQDLGWLWSMMPQSLKANSATCRH